MNAFNSNMPLSFISHDSGATLAAMNPIAVNLLIGVFLVVSIAMILLVLIQRPQGGGLSGAFGASGGSGAGQTAFGTKTGDVLTWATIGIFICFLVFAVILNFVTRPGDPISTEALFNTPAQTEQEESVEEAVDDANEESAEDADASITDELIDDAQDAADEVLDNPPNEDAAIDEAPATDTPAADDN